MGDGFDHLRALLPGVRLDDLGQLTGSNRSRVRRVRADSRSLIVKEFLTAGEGWVRETAALAVVSPAVRAPRLVAADGTPPIVVMTDAGVGASVADALLGTDPAAAADAVARSAADLGVEIPEGALDELRTLDDRLGVAALTPSDACPDNNVFTDDGLVLIDFEGAQWRHVAWDVAYLTVPWPSCWCSWRIPAAVTERAVDAYRAAFPDCATDPAAFRREVEVAATGWAYLSASWFLPRALPEEPPGAHPDRPRPGFRAIILHRFDQARHTAGAGTPALAELAGRLHDALTARWGDIPLPYAPAFTDQLSWRSRQTDDVLKTR